VTPRSPASRARALQALQAALRQCSACPAVVAPVVVGRPNLSPLMLVGQAPGNREGELGQPFAWTAGKTLFKWMASIGMDEETFRDRAYIAAVCRCFPGKNPKGGDRVPSAAEIEQCSTWMRQEFELVGPRLVVPVGKLAISLFMDVDGLKDVIGRQYRVSKFGQTFDLIPLPHPSGASTWHVMQPGKTLTAQALRLIEGHEAFRALMS
jgi:uracil-DNA glycosylase